jgi:hypothetical protein
MRPAANQPQQNATLATVAAAIAITVFPAFQTSAAAQVGTARVVEWNCPLTSDQTVPADPFPGALVAEGNLVYYVTRAGELRVVRMTMPVPTRREIDPVRCNWWDLDELTVTTGGLRVRPAGAEVFVRALNDIQRINTITNVRTRWQDDLFTLSDVAVRVNGSTYVYTTGTAGATDVVQRLTVNGTSTATVTRWPVGGSGAGTVPYSGVDVHPVSSHLVYYSEPLTNNIGELNTMTGGIRRWNLTEAGATVVEPRQLDVDAAGNVWVITGSGHLVRLNPQMTLMNTLVQDIPGEFLNNPVGIDADGVIGYTTSGGPGFEKVGMFSPDPALLTTMTPTNATAPPASFPLPGTAVTVPQFTGLTPPIVKNAVATALPGLIPNGEFVEALLDSGTAEDPADCTALAAPAYPEPPCTISGQPQGIANDPQGGLGTYFAAVGSSVLRVAHVTLPQAIVFPDLPTTDELPLSGPTLGSTSSPVGTLSANGRVPLKNALTGASAGTGSFTLTAYRKAAGQPARGSLSYYAPAGKVISLQITDVSFSGNNATVTGACKAGSACTTFKLTLTDGGWRYSDDKFELIKDPLVGLGLTEGGTLSYGSVRIWR